jgi:Tfp pilus assembly protein PilF
MVLTAKPEFGASGVAGKRADQGFASMLWNTVRLACASVAVAALLTACSSKQERAQAYYEHGLQLLHDGDVVKAGLEFRNALSLNNDMVPALVELAGVEQQQGRIDRAASFYQKVIDLDPHQVDARVRYGKILLGAGAVDEADRVAKEAMDLVGGRVDVLLLNAAVAFKKADMQQAESLSNAALKVDSKSAEARMLLAAIRLQRGDAKAALAVLDSAPQGQENNIGLILFKIGVLQELGDKAGIEKVLLKLAEVAPDYLPGRLGLVQFYASAGEVDKGIGVYRQLVDEKPDNVDLALGYVEFLRNKRGSDAAQAELERHLKQPKPSYRYTLALALLQFTSGQQPAAIDMLRKYLEQDLADAEAHEVKAELARMLLATGDKTAAAEVIEEVLKADPHHVAALTVRATMRLKDGDAEGAIGDLRTALNDDPKSQQANLVLAQAYEMAGHLELAEERLAETAANAAFQPKATAPYLAFLKRYQKLDRMEDVLNRVLSVAPTDVDTLRRLAEVRLRKGNWTGAQEIADAMRKLKSDSSGVANEIEASSLYGQGQYDASLELLKNVQTGEPAKSLRAIVQTYLAKGRVNEAKAYLQSHLEKNPKDASAFILLGSVELSKGDHPGAETSFQKALELAPDSEKSYQALAQLKAQDGDLASAEAFIKRGIERLPDSVALQISEGGLLERKGDFEAAIKTYEHALETDPLSLVAVNNLASLLADYRTDAKSLERAYTLSQRIAGLDVPFFKDTAGWVRYRRGEYAEAERLLEEAAKGLPRMALVQYHLARTQQALGKTDKAAEGLKKAIALGGNGANFPQKAEAQAALDAILKGAGIKDNTVAPDKDPQPKAGSAMGNHAHGKL